MLATTGGDEAADQLRDPVRDHRGHRELASDREPEGDSRVEVAAGDLAEGGDHQAETEAEAGCDARRCDRAGQVDGRGDTAEADEEEAEGSDDLGQQPVAHRWCVHGSSRARCRWIAAAARAASRTIYACDRIPRRVNHVPRFESSSRGARCDSREHRSCRGGAPARRRARRSAIRSLVLEARAPRPTRSSASARGTKPSDVHASTGGADCERAVGRRPRRRPPPRRRGSVPRGRSRSTACGSIPRSASRASRNLPGRRPRGRFVEPDIGSAKIVDLRDAEWVVPCRRSGRARAPRRRSRLPPRRHVAGDDEREVALSRRDCGGAVRGTAGIEAELVSAKLVLIQHKGERRSGRAADRSSRRRAASPRSPSAIGGARPRRSRPPATPLEPDGTSTRPSAPASELRMPAPRRSGIATSSSPTCARPERESTRRCARSIGSRLAPSLDARSSRRWAAPLNAASSGAANNSNARAAETG